MTVEGTDWTIKGLLLAGLMGVAVVIATVSFGAVQGDIVVNGVDPSNSLKFNRIGGTTTGGLKSYVTNTVPVTQGTNTWNVGGTVAVTQLTTTWNVGGTVTSTQTQGTSDTTIEFEHAQIHAGKHYELTYVGTLASGSTTSYVVRPPNTSTRVHFGYHVQTDQGFTLYVYENPTLSSTGTGSTPFNNDRNSANTSAVVIYQNPTITGIGTFLSADIIGSGGTQGNAIASGEEIILKQATDYLGVLTNFGTGSGRFIVHFEWYEL